TRSACPTATCTGCTPRCGRGARALVETALILSSASAAGYESSAQRAERSSMRNRRTFAIAMALAALVVVDATSAQERKAPRRAAGATLLTVETDGPASCRVVDSLGGAR